MVRILAYTRTRTYIYAVLLLYRLIQFLRELGSYMSALKQDRLFFHEHKNRDLTVVLTCTRDAYLKFNCDIAMFASINTD